jgi:hypothetical protein
MDAPTRNDALIGLGLAEPLPSNVVRVYEGHGKDEAQLRLDCEARLFALLGYRVVKASWVPAPRGRELFLGMLRVILLVALFAFPDTFVPGRGGSLTVTYVQP